MKSGIEQIVGKTITGVVEISRESSPRQQLWLTFSDGTRYEFYSTSADIHATGGVVKGPVRVGDGKIVYKTGHPEIK